MRDQLSTIIIIYQISQLRIAIFKTINIVSLYLVLAINPIIVF